LKYLKTYLKTYEIDLDNDKLDMSTMADMVNKYCANLKERIMNQKKLDTDIIKLALFLDFVYSYYIDLYSNVNNIEIQIKDFPRSIPRLRFLHKLVKADNDSILNLFIECINNNFIYDITNKQVPFDLITDLTTDEIEYNIAKIAFPLYKNILNEICQIHIKIDKKMFESNDSNDSNENNDSNTQIETNTDNQTENNTDIQTENVSTETNTDNQTENNINENLLE